MDPILRAVLQSWDWRPEILLVLTALGATYTLGWWHLRRAGHRRLADGWRLTSYLSGLTVLGVALLSPIDALQALLFTMHMVQHELLMMVAAPLLLLGNPLPFVLWGLPAPLRRGAGGLLSRNAAFRRGLRIPSSPRVAWVLFVGALWGWHSPSAYNAALRHELIHDLEHLSFFLTALLFWWHITGAAPRLRPPPSYGIRIAYVVAALAQNEILAVAITFAGQPLYAAYSEVPRLWGLSVLEDQMLGGAIMWVPGGMMYVLTAIILLARLLEQEKKGSYDMGNDLSSLRQAMS